MSEFTIRSESVDVEQIMKQIRARILEKRGADYTEDQIRELATVRLEKFLEPKNLRSDLLEQFRKSRPAVDTQPPVIEAPYTFDDEDIYATHRGALRFMRRLLNPLLKLLFNPNPMIHVIHKQAEFNVDLLKREARRKIEFERSRAEWNALYYEVLHNLVLETTRMGIEVQNLRMKVDSLSSRLDFSERRVRALEGVVQYRPEAVRPREPRESRESRERREADAPAPAPAPAAGSSSGSEGFVPTSAPAASAGPAGDGTARRRRRRRRGRRGGTGLPGGGEGGPGEAGASGGAPGGDAQDAGGSDEPFDDDNETLNGGDDLAGDEAGPDSDATDEPTGPSDDTDQ